MTRRVAHDAMNEKNKSAESRSDEIIAAFDREREVAHELNRRHNEHVRSSRADDRQMVTERRRQSR